MATGTLQITGDAAADELLNTDPLALLLGMLLDQQVPMEWAFTGPASLQRRLGHLDPARIAAMDPDALVAVFVAKPALHRYPAAMARRAHDLCLVVEEQYDGDASRVWEDATTGADLLKRLRALPGYGDEKAKIFVAILAKRFDVRPPGWEAVAGAFADATPRSVADIDGPASLAKVRTWKQAQKAAKKDKQDRPLADAARPGTATARVAKTAKATTSSKAAKTAKAAKSATSPTPAKPAKRAANAPRARSRATGEARSS
jgi:uncharacterized HhH-GPD family protein